MGEKITIMVVRGDTGKKERYVTKEGITLLEEDWEAIDRRRRMLNRLPSWIRRPLKQNFS